MKKFVAIILALISVCSCLEEPEFPQGNGMQDGFLTIEFGHKHFGNIEISTRSTVSTEAEDAIVNMYVIIFNSEGERIYGHFFDMEEQVENENIMAINESDCWYILNEDSGTGGQTRGKIRIKGPTNLSGGQIYLIGNVDPAVLSLSEERLNLVKSEEELMTLHIGFNQETTSRTGNLLMVGSTGISITDGVAFVGIPSIPLERLDSKINVKVGIVPGAKTVTTNKFGFTQEQEIESFTPTSWRVMNIPNTSWLIDRDEADVTSSPTTRPVKYFDSPSRYFETEKKETYTGEGVGNGESRPVHGFSFYMVESDLEPVKSVEGDYHLRDRRVKNPDGTYKYQEGDKQNNIWEYAPQNATYLVLDGEVRMKVNENNKAQTLNALVKYYIHLGDFRTDKDNYKVERNTHYTYTINIKGVNKIEVEVEKDNSAEGWDPSNELQSGSTGESYIAQEKIHTFDSHYGQRVYKFNFEAMLETIGVKLENGEIASEYEAVIEEMIDQLTWYVSTPYGRKGSPDLVNGGVEVPAGLDYKWVYFLKNDEEKVDGVTQYSEKGQWYPGDKWKGKTITGTNTSADGKKLMDVSDLCSYLRDQLTREALGLENDFDNQRNIRFTAFVDEYYYEEDPISHTTAPNFWQTFVNKPMRMMHILCSADISADLASSATRSVVTILQRSIQTIFNPEHATEAWGCETVDEIHSENPGERKSVGFFSKTDPTSLAGQDEASDCDSKHNGLYNTAKLWLLNPSNVKIDENSTGSFSRWDTYMDCTFKNDEDAVADDGVFTGSMKDQYATLRYACMMRNRDNDGDGYIAKDEVRWYLAATEQLMSLFIGDLGLPKIAQLYNVESPSSTNYMLQVVSSTAVNSTTCHPQRIWAEEGCSISKYHPGTWGYPELRYLTARCVRNLGLKNGTDEYDMFVKTSYPKSPIAIKKAQNSAGEDIYRFDITHLDTLCTRIEMIKELVPLDEHSEMSRVYKGFETGPLGSRNDPEGDAEQLITNGTKDNYKNEIKDYLIKGYTYCPPGYRMPNIREAAVMQMYVDDDINDDEIVDNEDVYEDFWLDPNHKDPNEDDSKDLLFAVSSYYRYGGFGIPEEQFDSQVTWFYTSTMFSLGTGGSRLIRCVKDIEPSEYQW